MSKRSVQLCRALYGLFALLFALGLGPALPAFAGEDYEIPVILPFTGTAAYVGNGEKAGLEAFRDLLNKNGGIDGRPLTLDYHDDQSSPQVAVQITTEIIAARPSVILGSTLTAMCNAMAPLVSTGPVMYCFSPAIHPAAGSYTFSATVSSMDMSRAITRFFRLNGWTRIGAIISTDASGQDADRAFDEILAMPENKSVSMVARAHFNITDVSVAAQVERIKAANPQAILAWTTGAAVGTLFRAIYAAGLNVPVATGNGNQSAEQLSQYTSFIPQQLYIPTGTFPEHEGLFKLDPRVEKAQHAMYATYKAHGLDVDNHTGAPWDPAMIVTEALRKLGPNASAAQLRQYIADLTDFAGAYGIYDFKATPQRGLNVNATVVTQWVPAKKAFVWVSKPGGDPLR